MSQETNNSIANVFKEIDKTIKIIGTDRLIEILKYTRLNRVCLSDEEVKFSTVIIQMVCDEFDISIEELFSTKRKNNRRNAIGVCAVMLQDFLTLDNANISYILKKPDAIVSLYKQEILRMRPNHPVDIAILKKIDNIKTKFKNQ
jgi:chromosomal replication initiation ATPase DnaA